MQIEQSTRRPDETISEYIFHRRNNFIKAFLDERYLKEYLQEHFKLVELSKVKIEFIRRDIKELLKSPIESEQFSQMISDFNKSDVASVNQDHEALFTKQINSILKAYIY